MARTQGGRAAQGAGTIRKKTVHRKGEMYHYWEARITVGHDPGTGRQIQRSFSGKTQKEVREKMQAAAVELNEGTYRQPSKMTVGDWMDIWAETYLGNVKPRTVEVYKSDIRLYIKPTMGRIRLETLSTHTIQNFYNGLMKGVNGKRGLSAKTVKNIHGVLHHALKQAVSNGLLRANPADACTLPRVEKKELKPLDETEIPKFLTAIKGSPYEDIFIVTLFTGLREGEVLGLTWDCVDFDARCPEDQQADAAPPGEGSWTPTLWSRPRTERVGPCLPRPLVLAQLRRHKATQATMAVESRRRME